MVWSSTCISVAIIAKQVIRPRCGTFVGGCDSGTADGIPETPHVCDDLAASSPLAPVHARHAVPPGDKDMGRGYDPRLPDKSQARMAFSPIAQQRALFALMCSIWGANWLALKAGTMAVPPAH